MEVGDGDEQFLGGMYQSVLENRSSENARAANYSDDRSRAEHSSGSRTVDGHRETDATRTVRTIKSNVSTLDCPHVAMTRPLFRVIFLQPHLSHMGILTAISL